MRAVRGLCFSVALSFSVYVSERATETKQDWDDGKREMVGGEDCVRAILCLTVCFWWALAQHVLMYNESRCRYTLLSGILIECRAPLCLQHCWFLSALLPVFLSILSMCTISTLEERSWAKCIFLHYIIFSHASCNPDCRPLNNG